MEVALASSSSVQGPSVLDTPTPGLNDQRLVPMFTSFWVSYWPSGKLTARLVPMMRSGW